MVDELGFKGRGRGLREVESLMDRLGEFLIEGILCRLVLPLSIMASTEKKPPSTLPDWSSLSSV